MPQIDYRERTYAGVLGKIIGVYFGRAVEGWTYDKIQARFGTVEYYVSHLVGMPLIVPDDDISGAFVFYRALADNGFSPDISAKQIGDTWLNYVIENKTILWFGGLSRSTEHTAFLRLKAGIDAPASGSTALNGQSMAEQIGAQIFIDTWAMSNPCDPDRAVDLARKAASVSHDGMAIDAACLLAAMESLAFEERDIHKLLDAGLRYVSDDRLLRLIHDVRDQCARTDDWHVVREWIARHHGYDKYPGNCPIATNHAVVLMALLLSGDDFHGSISTATSAGWDTDCNAGNVGCLNGIRLGLEAINAGANLRAPIADQMYVVSADGGECLSDAVRETRKILTVAAALRGDSIEQPSARFAFEYPGSTQGFMLHPDCTIDQAVRRIGNAHNRHGESGLLIEYEGLARGVRGVVSVKTFIDPQPKGVRGTSYFEVIASPTLYSSQTIKAAVKAYADVNPDLRFFIDYYDENDDIATTYGPPVKLAQGVNAIEWQVPDTAGHPIYRLGIELLSDARLDGEIALVSLDWSGSPQRFEMGRSMELSPSLTPWTTSTLWLNSFVSSAQNFAPDYTTTFSISHPYENGVVTTGTRDWHNYAVESRITFSQQKAAGLVARSRGHERYYAGVLTGGKAAIIKRKDRSDIVLAAVDFDYRIDQTRLLNLAVDGDRLALSIDGQRVVEAVDGEYISGAAGYVVNEGAVLGDRFIVTGL